MSEGEKTVTTKRKSKSRKGKPRDKAEVEVAVQVATRWIIAKLRNRRFFSLAEINAANRAPDPRC
jgi:hypothetical protein